MNLFYHHSIVSLSWLSHTKGKMEWDVSKNIDIIHVPFVSLRWKIELIGLFMPYCSYHLEVIAKDSTSFVLLLLNIFMRLIKIEEHHIYTYLYC